MKLLELKGEESKANHSLPHVAKVKTGWNYIFTPYVLIVWCLIKNKDNFNISSMKV
jgi:hypothetical protein